MKEINAKLPREILKWERDSLIPRKRKHAHSNLEETRKKNKKRYDWNKTNTFYGCSTEGAGAVSWMAMEGEGQNQEKDKVTVLKRKNTYLIFSLEVSQRRAVRDIRLRLVIIVEIK